MMNRTPRLVLVLLGLFLVSCQSVFPQESSLREIAKQLRAIKFKEEDFPNSELPKTAQELLPLFRRRIREMIFADLASETPPVMRSADMRARILAKLKDAGLSLNHDDNSEYGSVRELDVQTPISIAGLLAIRVTLGISCGVDSSLYLLQRQGSNWVPVIILEPGPYDQVNGAMENLEYQVAPQDDSGSWYLLVAFSHPWCTSCWSGVHYKVFRPSSEPEKPLLVYESAGRLYRCANQAFRLTVGKNEFCLSYPSMMSRDFDLFAKINVDRFKINGMNVQRVPPRTQPPVDFVDQWLEMPEDEAMKLVSETVRVSVADWHHVLSSREIKGKQSYESSYDLVQECKGQQGNWMVGLSIKESEETRELHIPPHVFFKIKTEKSGMVLTGIDQLRPKGCQGQGEKPTGADINDLQLPN